MAVKRVANEFYANVHIRLDLHVPVSAQDLENALIKARSLKLENVLDWPGCDLNDGSIEIEGVWK